MFLPFWKKLALARMARAARRSGRVVLGCESLEERATPAAQQILASSVEFGAAPIVRVFDAATGQQKFTVQAYEPTFLGGVRVAVGDVDGDGTEDLITGAGRGGGAVVKVFSGVDGHQIRSFFAGDQTNRGGASVAAADFDNDGKADIVIGAIQNGLELIQVQRGTDGKVLQEYRPFAAPIEGVTVAAGDYNGDGHPDVFVGAGVGGAPRVTVLDGTNGAVLLNAFAFESTARGGVQVAAGDLDGDLKADLIAAPGPGGGPRVVAFQGGTGKQIHSFFAYDDASTARNGVQVSVFDVNRDGTNDIVTARGPGQAPDLRAFDGRTLARLPDPQFPGLPFGSVDTTAPTVAVSAPSASLTTGGPVTFTVTYADASPVNVTLSAATVTLNKTGTANGTLSVSGTGNTRTVTISNVTGDGTLGISLPAGTATDAAGNPAPAAGPSATFAVDNTAPDTSITAGPAAQTSSTSATFTFTSPDATATFQTSLDGAAFAAAASPVNLTGLAQGTHTFSVRAVDAAGNVDATPATFSWTVDTTAPAVNISAPTPTLTTGGPVTYTVTYSDANPLTVTLAASNVTLLKTGTADGTVSVSGTVNTRTVTIDNITGDGSLAISIAAGTATDAAGNPAPAASTNNGVTVDNTAPDTSITAGPAAQTSSTSATFTFTSPDATATFQTSLDGAAFAAAASPVNLTGLTEGAHTFSVRAVDPAGNVDATPATYTWNVDLTAPNPPTITGFTPDTPPTGDGLTRATTVTVSGTAEAGSTVELFLDGNSVGTTTATGGNWSVQAAGLSDGPHTFTAKATDAAGNTGNASAGLSITVDATAPAVTLSAPTVTTDNTPDVTVNAADAGSGVPDGTAVAIDVDLNNDGDFADAGETGYATGTLTGGTATITLPALADGTYPVRARVTDVAGNEGTSATSQLTVDANAPDTAITTPADGASYNAAGWIAAGEQVAGTATDGTGLGVTRVDVTVVRDSDGAYWDGSAFVAGPVVLTATGTTAWSVGLPASVLADGQSYTVTATGVDALGQADATPAVSHFTFDTTAPAVTGVTVDAAATPDGAYPTGTVIDVLVKFGEPVTVNTAGGVPTLALNSGGTAAYVGGSGTDTLTFRYTVQPGDTAADLDYASAGALALNGGTITDAAGNPADLTLAAPGTAGSLGASRNIVIDTTAPTVASVTANPAAGAFKAGGSIDVTVTLSEPVTLSAGATLTLTLDTGATVTLTQDPINPAVFTGTYTVAAGESSPDLDSTSLAVTGGTLRDAAGNDASLTISPAASLAANAADVIDTTNPTVAIDTASTGKITGTAGDPNGSGVTGVQVSIFDPTANGGVGAYWDENTQAFSSPTELFFAATDTSAGGDFSTWSYTLPAAGNFLVTAHATDAAGNQGTGQQTVTVS